MSQTSHYSIKGVTKKSIFLMSLLGVSIFVFWMWLSPMLQDSSMANLISMALISTLIAPLSILGFIHFYAGNDADRLCVESSKLIKYIVLITIIDFVFTMMIGQSLSISLLSNASSYFISLLFIIIGCVVFLFNIQEIRDQLENQTSSEQKWTDAFWLMSSTFWILIVAFFFLGRSRKN